MNHVEEAITSVFAGILGQFCWDVSTDEHGSMRMRFGEPRLDITGPVDIQNIRRRLVYVQGEWSLWIRTGWWQLDASEFGMVTSASEEWESMRRGLRRQLAGQALTNVTPNCGERRITLSFDLGATLIVEPWRPELDEQRVSDDVWILFEERRGTFFAYREDGKYFYGTDADRPMRWVGDDEDATF